MDWWKYFGPALRRMWRGADPYSIRDFYNPPWLLLVLAPLVLLPRDWGSILPPLALIAAAWRRRAWWTVPIVGTSLPFIALTNFANVDWVPMLGVAWGGAVMPLFVTTKPQAGGVAMLAAWRRPARYGVLIVFMLVSVLLLPSWWRDMSQGMALTTSPYNASLMPFSLLPGIAAVALTLWCESMLWGCVASLLLAPYWSLHSLVPTLFLLTCKNWRWGLMISVAMWSVVGIGLLFTL
ncbi:MAG: hypothetical protein JXJ20_15160 [Anaerolineae bacterium]|jgi:hypothetical protein|nr:hypothetical protein [Anaerolineae bacterium]